MGNAGSQRQLPVVGRPGDWCNEEVVGVEPFVSAFKSTVVSDLAASNPTALTVLVDSRAKQPPRPGYSVSPSVELMDPVMPQPLTPRRQNEVGNWFRAATTLLGHGIEVSVVTDRSLKAGACRTVRN